MSDEIKIGQVWQELDNRPGFVTYKTVVGFDDSGLVLLRGASGNRQAKRSRFNGKTGGYRLIKDVTS